jgi:catechol 2,3-dioxygenase-like lactoylglutathione lyase family enzyme
MAPQRLDHVNILSPEPAETRTQMEKIMGMRLSERMVDDGLSWMRGANRLHHILGIVKGRNGSAPLFVGSRRIFRLLPSGRSSGHD